MTQRSSGPLPTETMEVEQPWGHNSCLDMGSVTEESQGLDCTLRSHVGDIVTQLGLRGRALRSWNLLC